MQLNQGATVRTVTGPDSEREPFRTPVWLGLCLFLAIVAFFLWEEHRAHILGVLPYALLLLCPIIHLFMHRGHGSHGADQSEPESHVHPEARRGEAS